jgi:hypothetical protein
MANPYRADQIQNWVGDFLTSTAFESQSGLIREYAPQVLPVFLERACGVRDVDAADIEEGDLKPALLDGVGAIEIPGSVRPAVPDLCADFLAEMQHQGRLSDGHTLGLYVRALKQPYLDRAAGKGQTIKSAGSRIGRNDPCPCGSGKKYKKCCLNP